MNIFIDSHFTVYNAEKRFYKRPRLFKKTTLENGTVAHVLERICWEVFERNVKEQKLPSSV